MAGEGGNQDWWGLLYLFLAGIVSVAVDAVRRLTIRLEELMEEKEVSHEHRRASDPEEIGHHHRRWDDPQHDNEEDEA